MDTRDTAISRSAGAPCRRGRPPKQVAGPAPGRERLLQAAQEHFCRHGFEQASLRAIGQQAGVDAALVAHHFGSKAELWGAVVKHMIERRSGHLQALQDIAAASGPLLARVTTLLDYWVDFVAQEQDLFIFFFREWVAPSERFDILTDRLVRPGYDICRPLWREASAAGLLATRNPAMFHVALLGLLCTTLHTRTLISRLSGQPTSMRTLTKALREDLHAWLKKPLSADQGAAQRLL